MVYITGDMHGELDRFSDKTIKKLKKGDFLIVCGDFGFIWDNSPDELKARRKIAKKPFYTLFIEGINENHSLLAKFPETEFMGGKAQQIEGNIFRLKKGEAYTICEKKFLTIGGGDTLDYVTENPDGTLFSDEERKNIDESLKRHEKKFDYIITHDAPNSIKQFMGIGEHSFGHICEELENIFKTASFTRWFFGKYHLDKQISYKLCAVFSKVYPLFDTALPKKKKARQKSK